MDRWTREQIETELKSYREMVCQAEQLEADIIAWETQIALMHDDCIASAVFKKPADVDMPISSNISDKTARVALNLPEEREIQRCRYEIMKLRRRTKRVEAWLKALSNRERLMITMIHVDGMVWAETVTTYNRDPSDGIAREERTLRRWKIQAFDHLLSLANYENVRDLSVI